MASLWVSPKAKLRPVFGRRAQQPGRENGTGRWEARRAKEWVKGGVIAEGDWAPSPWGPSERLYNGGRQSMAPGHLPVFVNKGVLERAILICLCIVRRGVVVTEATWSAKPKIFSIWSFKKKFTECSSRTYLGFVLSRGKEAGVFIHGLPSLIGYQMFRGVSSAPEVTLRHRDLSAQRRKLSAMGTAQPESQATSRWEERMWAWHPWHLLWSLPRL